MLDLPRYSAMKSIIVPTHDRDFKWYVGQDVGFGIITSIRKIAEVEYHFDLHEVGVYVTPKDDSREFVWKSYPYSITLKEYNVGDVELVDED